MKEFCPNKASKEFKELASIFGEDKAYFLWMRNKGNELDKAPNGAESKLFLTLLDYFEGDRVKALKAKAKVYSNDFLNWFGNWIDAIDKKYKYEIYDLPKDRYLSDEELINVRNDFNSGKDIVVYAASNDVESLLKGIDFRKNQKLYVNIDEKAFYASYTIGYAMDYANIYANQKTQDLDKIGLVKITLSNSNGNVSLSGESEVKIYPGANIKSIELINETKNVRKIEIKSKKSQNVSKVVDENGEPLVVYHGATFSNDIKVFNPQTSYFTENKVEADKYGDKFRHPLDSSPKSIPVFLNIRNPYIFDAEGREYKNINNGVFITFDEFLESHPEYQNESWYWKYQVGEEGVDIPKNVIDAYHKVSTSKTVRTYVGENIGKNNDGVIVKNVLDPADGNISKTIPITDYVPNSSNQIKSATDNKQGKINEETGEEESGFSTTDNNIYHNLEEIPVETKEDVKNLILSLLRKYYNFRQTLADNTKISATQSTKNLAKKQLLLVLSSLGLPENAVYINENNLVRFNDTILEQNINNVSDIIAHSKETSLQEKQALFAFMQWKFPQLKGIIFKKLKGENGHFENGVVVVDPDAPLDIAVEECLHPFVAAIRAENKELFDELLKEAQNDFKKLRGQIAKSYPGTKEEHIIDRELELVTQALSRHFADLWDNKEVDENGNNTKSVWRKALDYILELLGLDRIDFIKPETTLRELAEAIYKANEIHISDVYFVRKMYNKNTKPSLQESVFNIYEDINSDRNQYLSDVERTYKQSNPEATPQDIARILQASRIQYNQNYIDNILKQLLNIISQSLGLSLDTNLGYYLAPSTMSEQEKQLYEWTINSLNQDTYEAYKTDRYGVYNIMCPDSQASINVIYLAFYEGDLHTLDKELARNYIRLFWKSSLIQSGLSLFDNGHTTIQQQEQKLVEAVTQSDPISRINNTTILDYIRTFWDNLLRLAVKVFNHKNLSESELNDIINGVISAISASYDLEIAEGVQPLYDRIDGNYDSSQFISEKDKTVFRSIKAGTKVRLKSQLSRNVKNNNRINDLKLRLELLDSKNEDSIDDVFNSILEFLEDADIEIQKTLNYINTELKGRDISTWDAQRINYIKQDLIGYYEGLLTNISLLFSDPKSAINKLNAERRQYNDALDLESVTRQIRNDINSLRELYVNDVVLPYAEKILTDFVNESDAVKDKPLFIKNMKHWLYQDSTYGDLQAGELIFGMASRSRSPIVRIMEKMMSDVEFEKGRIVLKRGRELIKTYNKARSFGSQMSFSNFLKLFVELDGEDGTKGLPTGYFVRDRNYGRFYAEKDAFEQTLRDKYAKYGLKWKINDFTDQIQLIFPDENYKDSDSVYNKYYDELDEWLDKHCERRYTLEYYKQKRRYLSPDALLAQSFIQRQIDLLCDKAITENGFIDTNNLDPVDRQRLKSLRKQKRELASPYIFSTDSNGIVIIEEKQGTDARIAKEISMWNKHVEGKIKYKPNEEKFLLDLNSIKARYGEDSREVKWFIYENLQQKINPLFWDFLNSKIERAEQTAEYDELRARYRDIINHVKEYNGFVNPDLSKFGIGLNQNNSVWKELLRLEQRMSEIRIKSINTSEDRTLYLRTTMIPLAGSDETFYQYLFNKWIPTLNEHPEARTVFDSLFTYTDKKGKHILDAFKYVGPAVDVIEPGIKTVITTYSSIYNEIDESSEYVNPNFDKTIGVSLQPKIRKKGTKRVKGSIDYTNENYNKIISNKDLNDFYQLLLKTMEEANSLIPQRALERRYLLPQITGRGMSILGRTLCGKELFSAIGYGLQDFVGMKFAEQDRDVSTNWDLPRRPDGTVVNNVPIRFVKRLETPWLVSTDVLGSVMMYYDMAVNYSLKSKNLPSLELIEEAIDPKYAKAFNSGENTVIQPLNKQFDKVRNLMDFRYYGKEDRNVGDVKYSLNKVMLSTTTMSKRFRSFASLSMLALNFTTIEVGYIDAFLSSIADSIGGKYFGKEDLAVGYKETLTHLPNMLCNLGNPDVNDWMVCAMLYNQLSRSNSEIFNRTDQSRFSRLMHMTLMGGYTVADYLINTMILGATYHHYKLVDMPDGKSKKFMSKSDAIDIYTKYGYTEKEAIKKYNSSKITLKDAYFVKDGYLTVNDNFTTTIDGKKVNINFNDYITKKLENQIAGRLRDRTHLYNGIIPTTEKAKIQLNVWGSYVTLMRNFYVNTYWERAAVGFDYSEQETLPSGAFGRYVSEQAGMVNFETGETGNALGMSFMNGIKNYVLNAGRLLSHTDTKTVSRDQKYALKRIGTELIIIGTSIFFALWALAFARRHDLDDKTASWIIDLIGTDKQEDYDVDLGPIKVNTKDWFQNALNWARWKMALLAVRTMTERSTFYWPGTAMELIQSVSTAKSYTQDLGYMIDLFMDLFSINGHNSSEMISSASGYAHMSRGTRDLIKIFGSTGIDNIVRNWHTSGLKATLNWYSGVTPNNFILPNKSTWEAQEGIVSNKSNSKSKSHSKNKSKK